MASCWDQQRHASAAPGVQDKRESAKTKEKSQRSEEAKGEWRGEEEEAEEEENDFVENLE